MTDARMPQGTGSPECPRCLKMPELCVCEWIQPISTELEVLILQHPQEPDQDLGSARIAHLALPHSTLKVGLSWSNLKKALGKEAQNSRWAVLYLGSGVVGETATQTPRFKKADEAGTLQFVTKKGTPIPPPEGIEGIVVLDGTWSQAKTLWWRNPWLLKLNRAILIPGRKSLYQELRKEPRRECLSTLESIAESLVALGESPETGDQLRTLFSKLLEKQRVRLKIKKGSHRL